MPHLGKFYRQYPELQLRILGDVHYASLQHREADIAVRFGRPKDDYLIARKAGEVPLAYMQPRIFGCYTRRNYEWICVEVGGVQGQNSKS